MAGGYTKLFASIVSSSIWVKPNHIVRVWIAMLATCDHKGIVEGSIPGFANIAMVSIPEMEEALECLKAPDSYSRTKDFEGRRIEDTQGGWRIINHKQYRDRCQGKAGSRAEYERERRAGLHE
jgi:hypothetical protein